MQKKKRIYKKTLNRIYNLKNKRTQGMPIAYIFKNAYFYSNKFFVNNNVLIPRPESELLVELGYKHIKNEKDQQILDLCCGSGCIGISIYKKLQRKPQIVFSDISQEALRVCKKNLMKFKIKKNSTIIQSDLFEKISKKFNLILCNPPYVKHKDFLNLEKGIKNYEPKKALVSPKNGTSHIKKIIKDSKEKLYKNGVLIVEIGYDQSREIENFFKKHGFNDIVVSKDLSGIKRAISAKWKK
jgi:release factor glutamine methyltransferase